jgi:hypothetical protein
MALALEAAAAFSEAFFVCGIARIALLRKY